jgi:hypothetical protein
LGRIRAASGAWRCSSWALLSANKSRCGLGHDTPHLW